MLIFFNGFEGLTLAISIYAIRINRKKLHFLSPFTEYLFITGKFFLYLVSSWLPPNFLLSTLSHSFRTRVWMSTFAHTLFSSQLAESLDESINQVLNTIFIFGSSKTSWTIEYSHFSVHCTLMRRIGSVSLCHPSYILQSIAMIKNFRTDKIRNTQKHNLIKNKKTTKNKEIVCHNIWKIRIPNIYIYFFSDNFPSRLGRHWVIS